MTKPNYSVEAKTPEGVTSSTGQLVEDKFTKLWSNHKREPAKVAIGVSESLEYGAMKVSATVSLSCDQNEESIDKAGELAFYKAVELMRDAWREMGGPPKGGG